LFSSRHEDKRDGGPTVAAGDHRHMPAAARWPTTADELLAVQATLAAAEPEPWYPSPSPDSPTVAGCFVCFPRGRSGPGTAGDPGWAGAAAYRRRRCVARAAITGAATAPYLPGLLALRVGSLLDAVVRELPVPPDVLLVDATGYDHPRRAGLARHLGAVLGVPTVGVTHRPLLAGGAWPADERGAATPLRLDGAIVGYWVRTRAGRRPLAVHAGWRTDPATAVDIVLATTRQRTPTPLREARRLARTARAAG
jgi:deoxyribonuclease V